MRMLDKLLIIDIEATCWKNRAAPSGQESEIIQIGLCIFDVASALPREKESIIVRPQRSRVSAFCTELTGFTQADVDAGATFNRACAELIKKYRSNKRPWASWGNYDKDQFWKQCNGLDWLYPLSSRHYNLKTLFAVLMGLPREVEIPEALKILGLEFAGKLHRGDDDAWNVGRILSEISVATRELRNFSDNTDAYV